MNPTAKLLRDAAALIAKPSAWCQGDPGYQGERSKPTAHCAIDAIEFVICGPNGRRVFNGAAWKSRQEAFRFLAKAAHIVPDEEPDRFALCDALLAWNDNPRRKHATVRLAFERAAQLAEEREA